MLGPGTGLRGAARPDPRHHLKHTTGQQSKPEEKSVGGDPFDQTEGGKEKQGQRDTREKTG